MNLAIRIFAIAVVLAGAVAASVSSSSHGVTTPSVQPVSAALPGPVCGPGVPTCPKGK